MEIVITIKVGENDSIEIKVDAEKKEEVVEIIRPDNAMYAVWFDEKAMGWTKIPEMNRAFLIQQQEYFNMKLQRTGYLFLNEVYDGLGLPRTMHGQVVGWTYNDENRGFVDLGIFKKDNADFIKGLTPDVLLNFNVEGSILQYL